MFLYVWLGKLSRSATVSEVHLPWVAQSVFLVEALGPWCFLGCNQAPKTMNLKTGGSILGTLDDNFGDLGSHRDTPMDTLRPGSQL